MHSIKVSSSSPRVREPPCLHREHGATNQPPAISALTAVAQLFASRQIRLVTKNCALLPIAVALASERNSSCSWGKTIKPGLFFRILWTPFLIIIQSYLASRHRPPPHKKTTTPSLSNPSSLFIMTAGIMPMSAGDETCIFQKYVATWPSTLVNSPRKIPARSMR